MDALVFRKGFKGCPERKASIFPCFKWTTQVKHSAFASEKFSFYKKTQLKIHFNKNVKVTHLVYVRIIKPRLRKVRWFVQVHVSGSDREGTPTPFSSHLTQVFVSYNTLRLLIWKRRPLQPQRASSLGAKKCLHICALKFFSYSVNQISTKKQPPSPTCRSCLRHVSL